MARKKNVEIKVHVTSYGSGRNLVMRYRHPRTGEVEARTTGTRNRKEALKLAGLWEEELRNGRYKPALKMTWADLRNRYEDEYVLTEMKESSARLVSSKFDAIERILNPDLLTDIDDDAIELLKRTLREERFISTEGVEEVVRRSEETVQGHLRILKAALKWAAKKGMLHEPPLIETCRAAGSKGRPITLEEFERMLAKLRGDNLKDGERRIRPAEEVPQWERLLWGLWWSGLRLAEAMTLTWDNPHAPYIELDGENSTITIPGEYQKGGKDTVGPIVPEFYEFLSATPEDQRTGLVFPLPFPRTDQVSRVVTALGRAAGVRVSKTKHASAHDLRRSFGFRWAVRVMDVVLQKLMRHASIETTLKYYVGNEAKEMGKAVWQAFRATRQTESVQDGKEATV
jgi:integrase